MPPNSNMAAAMHLDSLATPTYQREGFMTVGGLQYKGTLHMTDRGLIAALETGHRLVGGIHTQTIDAKTGARGIQSIYALGGAPPGDSQHFLVMDNERVAHVPMGVTKDEVDRTLEANGHAMLKTRDLLDAFQLIHDSASRAMVTIDVPRPMGLIQPRRNTAAKMKAPGSVAGVPETVKAPARSDFKPETAEGIKLGTGFDAPAGMPEELQKDLRVSDVVDLMRKSFPTARVTVNKAPGAIKQRGVLTVPPMALNTKPARGIAMTTELCPGAMF